MCPRNGAPFPVWEALRHLRVDVFPSLVPLAAQFLPPSTAHPRLRPNLPSTSLIASVNPPFMTNHAILSAVANNVRVQEVPAASSGTSSLSRARRCARRIPVTSTISCVLR